MTRSFTLLVNPVSGSGAGPGAVVPVARLLREAGARVDVGYTTGPDDVPALVERAVARGDVVVSVGGDGMLASVAGPVSDRGGVLGLLPAGRGNDFARVLGLPARPTRPDDAAGLARTLLEADPRRVDLLEVTGGAGAGRTVVAGSVYAGVDARAGEVVDRAQWLPRRLQYPYAAVRSLLTYRPGRYEVRVDDVEHRWTAATVVVANSSCYGSGMRIAPAARLDDGRLDVVVIEAASRPALVRALPKVYDGAHVDLPEVTVLTGTAVEVRGSAAAPIPVGADGEPLGHLPGLTADPMRVRVLPAALSVLA
jgi:diacylglycerol kinase family enzyme